MRTSGLLWSDGGRRIVDLLTRQARVLTVQQIAMTWFGANEARARVAVFELEQQALLSRRCVLARPTLILDGPLVQWLPGDELPDFGAVAYRLRRRWREAVEPTEIVVATREAKRRLGGFCGGRWPRQSEISHDVSLSEVYLWYRTFKPEEAECWVPEAQIYAERWGMGERLPDALIRGRDGGIERVVEFGGSYRKQKLQAFHREMCEIPYEIW